MCDGCVWEIIHKARAVADELAEDLRIGVAKAMDLSSVEGFDRAVATLAAQLRAQARQPELDAARAAVAALDVDWGHTNAQQRRALVAQARAAARGLTAPISVGARATLAPTAGEVIGATRAGARAQGLSVSADFNAVDRRVVEHLTCVNGFFITDEYGRRLDAFSQRALELVGRGLEAGLGRDDIAADLSRAAEGVIAGRSSFYWEIVAGSFISTGRSSAQISAYAEAGVHRYVIEAVLDEQTTEVCRYLHGKIFEVKDGLDRLDAITRLERPEEIKTAQPWVRESFNEAGFKVLSVTRGGAQARITEVTESGIGVRDARGSFSRELSGRQLMDLGVGFPPFHGLCRTTTLPEV